ncbi:hypothetical protein EV363DRAFT_715912 [Boletus edulis]|nr:hypothetical protein EV363DRAFT_715912 [Boletus edulis]
MQGPGGAQLAAFQPQTAFPDQLLVQSHHASPDPYSRFLDRSSIYYTDSPTPPAIRSLDAHNLSRASHCDWSDYLLPQPLHYDYPHPDASSSPSYALNLPDMSAPPPDPSPSFNASSTSPATSSDITQSIRNACANNARTAPSRTSKQEGAGPRPREKKHGCWMCEKSFDRPSTLRKHLLVHTGEKGPFVPCTLPTCPNQNPQRSSVIPVVVDSVSRPTSTGTSNAASSNPST